MDIANPTARALLALEVLQNSPGISGERLAARIGVSDRAVRRYIGILRDAGIPIESTPGRYGGYRLGRGTRLPPLMLSPAEALGLVMAALEGGRSTADTADPVGSAIGKIIRVLPASVSRPAEAIRQVSTAHAQTETTNPDPQTTALLAQSCASRRRVRISYRMGPERERVMDVDPWAVSLRRGRWYLLCWSHSRNARRILRVDRVTSVDVGEERFTPPADLDPIQTIEEHLAEGWEYQVEIVIDAPVASVAEWIPRNLGRLDAIDAGRTRLVATTGEPLWYSQRLTAIRAPFHVVKPRQLREAVHDLGRRLLRAGTEVDPDARVLSGRAESAP